MDRAAGTLSTTLSLPTRSSRRYRGKWMQALEPDVLTGATPPPQVITHQAGYAPTVTVKDLHRRRARRRLHCAHARDTTHPMTPN